MVVDRNKAAAAVAVMMEKLICESGDTSDVLSFSVAKRDMLLEGPLLGTCCWILAWPARDAWKACEAGIVRAMNREADFMVAIFLLSVPFGGRGGGIKYVQCDNRWRSPRKANLGWLRLLYAQKVGCQWVMKIIDDAAREREEVI